MLTPPGMGGKYRITGNTYPRMRRPRNRRRLVLVGGRRRVALGVAGWGTLQLIDVFSAAAATRPTPRDRPEGAPHQRAPSTGPRSPCSRSRPPSRSTSTTPPTRSGLAKTTADELKKRGFKIGKVANAPGEYDKKVGHRPAARRPDRRGRLAREGAGHQLRGAGRRTRHPQGRRRRPGHRRRLQGKLGTPAAAATPSRPWPSRPRRSLRRGPDRG